MEEPMKKKRNRLLAERVIRQLEQRNHKGYYAETAEEAKELALKLMPEGSSVAWGGSMTMKAIGLIDAVRNGNYNALDRDAAKTPEDRSRIMRSHNTADFFLTSCNAMSEDGQMVNIDGTGNRVACIAFGPKTVLMIVSMDKIVRSLEDAIHRAKFTAAPVNAQRFDISTPCRETGFCADCRSPQRICCQTLITSYSMTPGRFQVILVNESLGY